MYLFPWWNTSLIVTLNPLPQHLFALWESNPWVSHHWHCTTTPLYIYYIHPLDSTTSYYHSQSTPHSPPALKKNSMNPHWQFNLTPRKHSISDQIHSSQKWFGGEKCPPGVKQRFSHHTVCGFIWSEIYGIRIGIIQHLRKHRISIWMSYLPHTASQKKSIRFDNGCWNLIRIRIEAK